MILCNLEGGLGNQMFQYACAKSLSLEHELPLFLNYECLPNQTVHNGFELKRVFGIDEELISAHDLKKELGFFWSSSFVRKSLKKLPIHKALKKDLLIEPYFNFWNELYPLSKDGGILQGYWQSPKYFENNSEQIHQNFTFKPGLTDKNAEVAKKITSAVSISVHVRRGDYISNKKANGVHGVSTLEYYHQALKYLLDKEPEANIFAFSDDVDWVREFLLPEYPSMQVIDFNKAQDSFFDMYLMSMCSHNIVANSSFSWWGAWLNRNKDKIVVAPKRWFVDGRDSSDLIPSSWKLL
jgi:hypothetical protein